VTVQGLLHDFPAGDNTSCDWKVEQGSLSATLAHDPHALGVRVPLPPEEGTMMFKTLVGDGFGWDGGMLHAGDGTWVVDSAGWRLDFASGDGFMNGTANAKP
jgi:hypothetical protein